MSRVLLPELVVERLEVVVVLVVVLVVAHSVGQEAALPGAPAVRLCHAAALVFVAPVIADVVVLALVVAVFAVDAAAPELVALVDAADFATVVGAVVHGLVAAPFAGVAAPDRDQGRRLVRLCVAQRVLEREAGRLAPLEVGYVVRAAAHLYRVDQQRFVHQALGFVESAPVRHFVEGLPAWRVAYHAAQAAAQLLVSEARRAAGFAATHPDHAACPMVYRAARYAARLCRAALAPIRLVQSLVAEQVRRSALGAQL